MVDQHKKAQIVVLEARRVDQNLITCLGLENIARKTGMRKLFLISYRIKK